MSNSQKNWSHRIVPRKTLWLSTWGSVIVWCLVLFLLSAQPNLTIPGEIPESDKVAHLSVYAVLGWLWSRAVRTNWPTWPILAVLFSTIVFTGGYGLSDEWHQIFVPGRSADLLDALADVCGGTLGGVGFLLWLRYRGNRQLRVTRASGVKLRDPYDPVA